MTKLVVILLGWTLLKTVCDDASLDQVNYAVGEHFRVDTEVVLVVETTQYGIRNGSNACLQGGAVLHEAGNDFADMSFHIGFRRCVMLDQWAIGMDKRVDSIEIEQPCCRGCGAFGH